MADAIDLGIPGIGPATPLDRGGSAYVYLAEQEDFGRKVAVKVLFDALEDDATYRRFDRECRAIGAVSHHPNIAVVHGRGLTRDERPYLVMEYRAGGSLADRLSRRGRFTEPEAINIGIKIGQALQVAHDAGVLHRDVKPANILLSAYDEPALADFGIARMDGTHKTTEGVFSASVVHASREILDSGTPTPRSDVYALASTMFELVTGAPAYADDADQSVWAVVDRVLNQDPPDPKSKGVSEGLSAVLQKAMDHDETNRHSSAAAFVAELQELRLPASSRMETRPVEAVTGKTGPVDRSDIPGQTGITDQPTEPMPATALHNAASATADRGSRSAIAAAEPETSNLPELSRTGLLISVGVIAVGSLAIGLFSALGPSRSDRTSVDVGSPQSQVQAAATDDDIVQLDTTTNRTGGSDTAEGVDQATVDRTTGGTGVDQPTATNPDDSTTTTEQLTGPFTPELRFPRAEIGPLQTDERYVLLVAGAPDEAEYRIIVDGRPVTRREPTPPVYFPKPGRHEVQVEVATDDRVELTDAVEIYVSDRAPTSGYRVNLSAIRSRPENWPEALRQFDQLVADGHDSLEISLSDRQEGSALPFWNFYIRYGQDREGAIAYCEDRGLSNNECYTAEVE